LLYEEILQDEKIHLKPTIKRTGKLGECYGHNTFDCLSTSDLATLKAQFYWDKF